MSVTAKALTLDGHGVVYYRKREVPEAVADQLVAEFSLPLPSDEVRAIYESLQERAFSQEITYPEMLRRFSSQIGIPGREELVETLIRRYSAAIVLDPDLREVLTELRSRRVIVGMITNSINQAGTKLDWLKESGVAELFDVIVSSIDEGCRKPDPEIYLRFGRRAGIPPGRTVFVGHDIAEVEGAKRAGMITVCLRCDSRFTDHSISRLRELLALPIWPEKKEARI